MPRYLVLAAIGIGLVAIGVVVASFFDDGDVMLQRGTFIVLTLTLLALLRYAFDTYTMASVSKMRWDEESILGAYYEMTMAQWTGKYDAPPNIIELDGFQVSERVLFTLLNDSKAFLRVRVWCNFKINGEPVDFRDEYCGREIWNVYPMQRSTGWFLLSQVLALKGKTIANMIEERTDENRKQQLTMDLRLEYGAPELGRSRELPARRHFFDFKQWNWIPELTFPDVTPPQAGNTR